MRLADPRRQELEVAGLGQHRRDSKAAVGRGRPRTAVVSRQKVRRSAARSVAHADRSGTCPARRNHRPCGSFLVEGGLDARDSRSATQTGPGSPPPVRTITRGRGSGPDRVAIRLPRARLRDSRSATQTGPREALMPRSDAGVRGVLPGSRRDPAASGTTPRQPGCDADRAARSTHAAERCRHPRRPARNASRSGCVGHGSPTAGQRRRPNRATRSCRGATASSAASCPDRVAIRLPRAQLRDSRSATQTGPGHALVPRSNGIIRGVLPGSRRDPAASGTTPRQPVCDADRTGPRSGRGATASSAASCPDRVAIRLRRARHAEAVRRPPPRPRGARAQPAASKACSKSSRSSRACCQRSVSSRGRPSGPGKVRA